MNPPFSPSDARAVIAWITTCERYRAFQLLRTSDTGQSDVDEVTAAHPDATGAMTRLHALAAVGDG